MISEEEKNLRDKKAEIEEEILAVSERLEGLHKQHADILKALMDLCRKYRL